jgi:phosphomannomutase
MTATTDAGNLSGVFKAYDLRGTVPDQLDERLARAVGNAFVQVATDGGPRPRVAVGYDMRLSSPGLAEAFADGATRAGADVAMIGLASTDQLYFASGRLGIAGAMFTASHNPAQYNGIKMCRAAAAPVGQDTGLAEIRDLVAADAPVTANRRGSVEAVDVLDDYADFLRSLAPVAGRRLSVVVDAGNGMAGHTAPAVLGALDLEVTELYYELDGTFPNHEANPLEPENLRDLQAAVVRQGADLGLAVDGDADRCFVVDERGRPVDPSAITALIAARELDRNPGGTVVHNLITSRAVPQVVAEHGGVAVRSRVGHSYIKATMAETGAVFGGEHSGHFYFRDFWRADSGMLAALHTLAALAEQDRPLSALLEGYSRFAASGEINSRVDDPLAVIARVEAAYGARAGVDVDHLDGLSVTSQDWWFNLRPSNTEPLLRLNVEGSDVVVMAAARDAVLELIRKEA